MVFLDIFIFILNSMVERQCDGECGTLAGGTLHSDVAAMAMRDLAADGEADPAAFIVFAFESLENGKDLFLVFFVKPDALVLKMNGSHFFSRRGA